jgi:general secretion pathway protein D
MNKKLIFSFISITLFSESFAGNSGTRSILSHIPGPKNEKEIFPTPKEALSKITPPSSAPMFPTSASKKSTKPALPPAPTPDSLKEEEKKSPEKDTTKTTEKKKSIIPVMPKPPKQAPSLSHPKLDQQKETPPTVQPPTKAHQKNKEQDPAFKVAKTEEQAEQKINFYFEDATLENVTTYIENLFKVKFLPDDAVKPLMSGAAPLEGHKVTFKTNRPFSRKEAWDVFLRLLDLSGLTLVPGAVKNFYRITSIAKANHEPLPTYFNVDYEKLPNSAQKIRYVYFVKNNPLTTIQNVMTSLASTTARITAFTDLDALIITERASNIRSLMRIIDEFDKSIPEAMSVLKLKKTDAKKVTELYKDLTASETKQGAARFMQQRKQPSSFFFPADVRIIPEERTNSLILLGPKRALSKIEDFIIKHIDTDLDLPYSPLHVYTLQNTSATNTANILKNVITFGSGSPAAQFGGVRDGQKYFKAGSISITPETSSNRLIIKAEEDDYEKLKEIIKILDVAQPQVAIEVLIVDVTATNSKEMNTQLRNRSDGSILNNVNFQSAQLGSVQANTDGGLVANLIGLATGAGNPAGTTMLSIGETVNGIWGLFRILKTYSNAKIVSNPFLLATNKYQSTFTFGETRRVISATVGGDSNSVADKQASLTLKVTPQINTDGIVTMDVDLNITEFSNESSDNADTTTKSINTFAHLKNEEVLALGGITKNTVSSVVTKVPLLGDIPLLGSLFKGKTKAHVRSNLIIFISPKIITPLTEKRIGSYTNNKSDDVRSTLASMDEGTASRDPFERSFFESSGKFEKNYLESFDEFMDPHKKSSHKKKKIPAKIKVEEKSPEKTIQGNKRKRKRLARKRART